MLARGLALTLILGSAACGSDEQAPTPANWTWSLLESNRSGALLSVWGTRHDDVWVVGGDQGDGLGPTVLHFDGKESTVMATGETEGNLWWVTGLQDGPIFMGGDDGLVLRHEQGRFEHM